MNNKKKKTTIHPEESRPAMKGKVLISFFFFLFFFFCRQLQKRHQVVGNAPLQLVLIDFQTCHITRTQNFCNVHAHANRHDTRALQKENNLLNWVSCEVIHYPIISVSRIEADECLIEFRHYLKALLCCSDTLFFVVVVYYKANTQR